MRHVNWLTFGFAAMLLGSSISHGQVVSYSPPVVTYYAPVESVPRVTAAPVTTYYAPATPVTTYYAPSAPVTTYYAPSVPVTTYYAPAPTTVLSPVVPAATVVRTPVWVYDPTRILPARRWRLLYY